MAHCASCDRSYDNHDGRQPFVFRGVSWCSYCAKIQSTSEGLEFVSPSSPGRIVGVNRNDPLEAWIDCYEMKPKQRILKQQAK